MQPTPVIPIPRDEASLRWARTVLGVSEGTTAEEVRGLTLSRLEEMEFVPPAQWEQAILLLEEEPSQALWQRDLGYEMHRAREVELRKEVEGFAKSFFSIPPALRHTRWRELMAACEFSLPLTVWLESLTDGFGVVPPQAADKNKLTNELAAYFVQAFPLPPTLQLAVDEELLQRAAYDPAQWQKAAQRLKRCYPQIAGLVPQLSEHLCQFVKVCDAEKKAEARRMVALRKAAKKSNPFVKGAHLSWVIPLLFMVVTVLRVLVGEFSSPQPNSSRPWNSSRSYNYNPSGNAANTIPDLSKPVHIEEISPEDTPSPNLVKQSNVDEAYRRMLGIPPDAEVYFGENNTIFYRNRNPVLRIGQPGTSRINIQPPGFPPNNSMQPEVIIDQGRVIIDQGRVIIDQGRVIIRQKEESPVNRILNSPPESFMPDKPNRTNPSPGSTFPGPQPFRSNVPYSAGGRPFP